MRALLQKFGGSLYTPVLFTAFAGIMAGLSIVFKDTNIMGNLAAEGTLWHTIWHLIGEGAWTIFRQLPIIFVVGMPIALAKKSQARASLEALLCFLTYHYFISTLITMPNNMFGIDVATANGITTVAGITTFDMSILASIIIALLTVFIHDRYFDKELPEVLSVFGGSVFVYALMFFLLIPIALLTVLIWPIIQGIITSSQELIISTGTFGVGIYTFLERILIPTGLHHLVYQPFEYGDLVVSGGAKFGWINSIEAIRASGLGLREAFPAGGYLMFGLSKVFGTLGMAAAFYATANPDKKKKTLGLLIPITLTAVLVGVTEPFEFTFIFIAPVLFLVHAVLAGLMSATMFLFGISGDFANGVINFATLNWIPLGATHGLTYILQIAIGLGFSTLYFFIFRFAILKWNLSTPGREEGEEVKFYSKQEVRALAEASKAISADEKIVGLLQSLGGTANIASVSNCMTRLRIDLVDGALALDDKEFKKYGAHGTMRNKNNIQVIIGTKVPQVREKLELLIEKERNKND